LPVKWLNFKQRGYSTFKNEEPVYWCVVEGSKVWIENGSLPLGSASSLNLNAENAQVISNYQSKKVVWLNYVEVEQVLPMTPLRSLLHYPEELFLVISRAIQFGHMSQTLCFCPQCGGRNHLNFNQLAMQCGDYRSGDIKLDKTELVDAQWFGFDELPEVAPEGTIARALIREVANN
jgi:NADH pyrophosphatase NudC (nudix superfamily)